MKKKNILIFASHPAQFHFFKNSISILKEKGNTVHLLVKTKDILTNLIDELGWEYHNILPTERKKNKFSIIKSLFLRNFRIYRFAKKHNIDLFIGTDASLAQVGKILKIPCITTLEDDYKVIKKLADLTYPFTSTILVPEICDVGKWNSKKIGYKGYMKLAYLHPNYFHPDRSKIKISTEKPLFIIRLSGLSAHHDFGIKGISHELLLQLISILEQHGSVLISSENKLNEELKKYQLTIPLADIHQYLSFADIVICDSQSMAVESAILGTPCIRISSFKGQISVLEELEHKYKLTFGFKPNETQQILNKINDILRDPNRKEKFQDLKNKMLNDQIDVTAMLSWFIENYPQSIEQINLHSF
ncbi:MAG: DUF354 domain-containing protein [Flavobacteriia bacterium]|nr:DUF354 domain-containing protein [Flavobacteriia bacterium]